MLELILGLALPLSLYLYFRYQRDRIVGLGPIHHRCPHCHADLPRFRMPRSLKQMLWGGWTCDNCGSEVDRHGLRQNVTPD